MIDLRVERAFEACPSIKLGENSSFKPQHPNPRLRTKFSGSGALLVGDDVITYADIECVGSDNIIAVADGGMLINTRIRITGDRCRVIIGPGAKVKAAKINLVRDDCLVVIGAGTTFESGAFICDRGQAIIVGNDCMFSNGAMARTTDGHGIWDNASGRLINSPAGIVIGHHVWLGNGARVNKGAVIGMGSVVGQSSIVSGRLDAECVYAGVPARKVRSGIHWTRNADIDDVPSEYRVPGALDEGAVDTGPPAIAPDRAAPRWKGLMSSVRTRARRLFRQ